MNKAQLIDELSGHFDGNRRAAQNALEAVIGTITRQVAKGEAVATTGFGKFERRIRPAGTARNPQTGAVVKTKKKSVPKFTAGAEFKAVVNGEKKAAPAKKAPAKKTTAKKTTAKKTTAKKTAKKAPARKAPAKRTTAKKTAKKTARKR